VPRYRHMMGSLTRSTMPGKILVIDVVSIEVDKAGKTGTVIEEFASAHLVQIKRIGNGYLKTAYMSFGTVSALWDRIEQELQCGGVVWVFSYNCASVWSLLKLWEGLEDGRIRLVGRDWRNADINRGTLQALRLQQQDPLRPVSASNLRSARASHVGYLVTECPPAIAKVKVGNAPAWLHWVDTQNYGAIPERSLTRGTQTCEAVSEFVIGMLGKIGSHALGSLCATSGSQALHGFKFGYLTDGIYCHDNKDAERLEAKAYFGGRCEVYLINKPIKNAWHIDIRSLYPYVCATYKLPVRFNSIHYNDDDLSLNECCINECCIADVTISTDMPYYPYRRKPRQDKNNNPYIAGVDWLTETMQSEVIYPTGTFRTTLCYPELHIALDHKHIKSVHSVARYTMEPALKKYAETLHNLRCEISTDSEPMLAGWIKSMLVALPGKFGQRERCWYTHPDERAPFMYGEWYGSRPDGSIGRFRSLAGTVQEDRIGGLAFDSNMAIAAWITSLARAYLLQYIEFVGWDHVYYCDTDALVVDDFAVDVLQKFGKIKQGEMGKFHIKYGPGPMVIYGVKHYREGSRLVCAGLPKGYTQMSDGNSMCDFREVPTRTISKGERPSSDATIRNYTRVGVYRHREVCKDGTTTPIFLHEG
jgi:DNA polymerase type B, organellar and viral